MNDHLKQFTNHAAYQAAKNSLDKPNVVLCTQENEIHYNPYVDLIYIHYRSGTTAPALRGMTWEEYVNSEYNTSQYTNYILNIDSFGYVIWYDQGVTWYLSIDFDNQRSTDIIDETKTYNFPAD